MNIKYLLLLLITLVTLFACNNEDVVNPHIKGLQVNADFLRLSDNNNITAGNLIIRAGVPEVTIKWNIGNLCNLDTAQTTLKLSKGIGTLPIKWNSKLEAGTYGPEGVAFKAGVQIIAGDKSQYVPLVWAEKIDSTEILKSAIQTRSTGDIMPRVAQISMIPTTVNMNDVNGGTMYISLTDVSFTIIDVSEITSDLNIDMSKIPNYITASQMLDFKWTAAGAPTFGFSARIVAMSEGLTQEGTVTYGPTAPIPPTQYSVSFRATAGGTVSSAGGSGNENQIISSTATPNAGYAFQGWYDTANNTKVSDNVTYSVTLNATTKGKNYEARFTPKAQYKLNLKILGKGTISTGTTVIQGFGGTVELTEGMVTLTPSASVNMNAQFVGWYRGSYDGTRITASYGSEYVDAYGNLHIDPKVYNGGTYSAMFNNLGSTRNRIYVDPRMNLDRNTLVGNNVMTPPNTRILLELHSPTIGTSGGTGRSGLPMIRSCNVNNVMGYAYVFFVPNGDLDLVWETPGFSPSYGGRCDFWIWMPEYGRHPYTTWRTWDWEWTHDLYWVILDQPNLMLSKQQIKNILQNIRIE